MGRKVNCLGHFDSVEIEVLCGKEKVLKNAKRRKGREVCSTEFFNMAVQLKTAINTLTLCCSLKKKWLNS